VKKYPPARTIRHPRKMRRRPTKAEPAMRRLLDVLANPEVRMIARSGAIAE